MKGKTKRMNKKMFTLDHKLAAGEELSEFEKMMLASEFPTPPVRNAIVEGVVVNKSKNGYIVDIGQKCDAEVSFKECSEDLDNGSTHTFLVFSEPDEDGGVMLSYDRAHNWIGLIDLVHSGETAQAKVYAIQHSRGGRVSGVKAVISGVRAFIPRSEMLYRGNLEELLQTEIPVKVLEADPVKGRFGQLILSQRRATETRQDEQLASIKTGDILKGVVSRLIQPGALVDLGGDVTGLIHRTELSGNRHAEPAEVVQVGDEVEVKVLNVNMDKRQVSLSRRAVLQQSFFETVRDGDILEGVVARFQDYGAFVTVGGCVDGLLHTSELISVGSVCETFKVGEKIRVRVKTVDAERQRLALTRKGTDKGNSEKVA